MRHLCSCQQRQSGTDQCTAQTLADDVMMRLGQFPFVGGFEMYIFGGWFLFLNICFDFDELLVFFIAYY